MFNTPAILRAYWRAFADLVNAEGCQSKSVMAYTNILASEFTYKAAEALNPYAAYHTRSVLHELPLPLTAMVGLGTKN